VFVIVVGLNHRTVSLDVLERMTVSDERLPKALDDLGSREHIAEVVLLSTCHRTEAYVLTDRFHGAVQDVRNFLSELAFIPPEEFSDHLYTYHDDAAVAHLFGVAAGLDSVVLGESEILGQVRSSWEQARAHGSAGTVLSDLFRHALEVGKRARSETGIARSTTSLSHAAVAMAAERLGGLAGRTILVLGAGDVGESMAVALAGSGVDGILVANRTWSKAVELAARVGGRALTLDAVPDTLASVDLLLTSTGAPSLVLERADLEAATSMRGEQPLLVVDVAVPRDVDPGVATLPGVTLLDMDDLRAFVDVGIGERRKEVARVQSIIADEVERFLARSTARQAAPTIAALRARVEELRVAEIERFRARLASLDPDQREAVEAVTRGVLAKLLHEPTVRLKEAAGTPDGPRLNEALRALFDL